MKKRVRDAHLLFKALSHPLRLRILGMLSGERMSVIDLIDELEVSQVMLSRHLAYLRNLGLVHSLAQAQWRYYSINPKFAGLLDALTELGRGWEYD